MIAETTIYYPPQVRDLWPSPLVQSWASSYPCLFDQDDIRITRSQSNSHFNEWFAAIHLFHRDGVFSLVEKYLYSNHRKKKAILRKLLAEPQRKILGEIQTEFQVQPPDLLVFTPDFSRIWFAEVKGPGDKLRPSQKQSHDAIRQRLGVRVELINVRLLKSALLPSDL